MINYKDKEYQSKAHIVRELYDLGIVSMSAESKKQIAKELEMTVQTVHATIKKHLGTVSTPSAKPVPIKIPVEKNPKARKYAIILSDKEDPSKYEGKRILITYAPNHWGLPVTNPPMEVIDDNYDPNEIEITEESHLTLV